MRKRLTNKLKLPQRPFSFTPHPHIHPHLIIQVFFKIQAQMMVKIVAAWHGFYFIEAQVILISLLKRENNIYKVFTKLNNISKPGTCSKRDH